MSLSEPPQPLLTKPLRLYFRRPHLMTVEVCYQLRREMELFLNNAIKGARVTDFLVTGIPRTSFP